MRLFFHLSITRSCGANGATVNRLVHWLHWRWGRADCRQCGPSLLQPVSDALSTRRVLRFLCCRCLLILNVKVLKTVVVVRCARFVAESSAVLFSLRLRDLFLLGLSCRHLLP